MTKYHNNVWRSFEQDGYFVFGSNLAGRHGAGAAKWAEQHYGAIYGKKTGEQGSSYAIPTKDGDIQTLPLSTIQEYIDDFIEWAADNFEDTFFVTQIGCGLAGYTKEQIAPMFKGAPENCVFPIEWKKILDTISNLS